MSTLIEVVMPQVSEGLDFADSNARAVLIFGIPFPNVKDTKVGLKKAYNDAGQRTHRLLSGDQWYSQQAFRYCLFLRPICSCRTHSVDQIKPVQLFHYLSRTELPVPRHACSSDPSAACLPT